MKNAQASSCYVQSDVQRPASLAEGRADLRALLPALVVQDLADGMEGVQGDVPGRGYVWHLQRWLRLLAALGLPLQPHTEPTL